MFTRARERPNQEQGRLLVKYLIIGFIGGFVIFNLFSSRELLDPPTSPPSSGHRWPESKHVSNETILSYSEFNPRLWTDRDRIQFLLDVTKSGKTNLNEAMKLRKTHVKATTPNTSREQESATWISPFMELNDTYIRRFFQMSQKWLGDGDRLNPRMVQDLVRTVKRPLDRNSANWQNTTSTTTQIDGASFKGESRYQNCAVVGNIDINLTNSYGKQIDSHEMVIRLNNADVSKYSMQVGNKTTLSFMNSNVFLGCIDKCLCDKYGEQVPIVLFISQAEHLLQVASLGLCKRKFMLLVTPSLFDALCSAIAKWYSVMTFLQETPWGVSEWNLVYEDSKFRYSSGLQAVVLALGICEQVDLFGFDRGGTSAGKQQYHTEDWKMIWLHDYASEYRFYDDLVHNMKIPFLTDAGISIPKVRIFH